MVVLVLGSDQGISDFQIAKMSELTGKNEDFVDKDSTVFIEDVPEVAHDEIRDDSDVDLYAILNVARDVLHTKIS